MCPRLFKWEILSIQVFRVKMRIISAFKREEKRSKITLM